jgi:exonuclease VII large subunit
MPNREKARHALADAAAQAESEDTALFTVARRLFPELAPDSTFIEIQQLIVRHCALRHKLRAEQVRKMSKTLLTELLEADTEKASGKTAAIPESLTGLMTKTNIAEMFGVSSNNADQILSKYQHFKVGRKYRMRVEDMPPRYKKIFGPN